MTKLKKYRESHNLRLWEVAEKTGLAVATAHQQEQRGIRTVRVAERYAAALGCRPEELMEFSSFGRTGLTGRTGPTGKGLSADRSVNSAFKSTQPSE